VDLRADAAVIHLGKGVGGVQYRRETHNAIRDHAGYL
jgi:hypothetical protein